MTTLRPYQQEAIDALYACLESEAINPAVVIPTGGGKTPILATLARDTVAAGGRCIILSHVRELLEQARDTIEAWAPELRAQVGHRRVGVYSAGLRSRDTDHDVLIAGIQSVFKRACDLGPLDLAVIDEAHLIPPAGDGMYQQFIREAKVVNPHLRIVGLTATPYRLGSGLICGRGQVLDRIVYEAPVRKLIDDGWLCKLVSKAGDTVADTSDIKVRGGEFVEAEAEAAMRAVLRSACDEIIELTAERRGTLIFAPGVAYARDVADYMRGRGVQIETVFGDTDGGERKRIITDFKAQRLRYIANCSVLTTGFDARHVDCVALLRPTLSPGLYYQCCGRGLRLYEGKTDCLVLDFAGNVMRHGPIDDIRAPGGPKSSGASEPLVKMCPECKELVPLNAEACECGYEWPRREEEKPKHAPTAAILPILSTDAVLDWRSVTRTSYREWEKVSDPTAPRTMRVDYQVGLTKWVSEWVCLEHEGFARAKAERWWRTRSKVAVPDTVAEAVELAKAGALAEPVSVCVRQATGQYDQITGYDLGPVPDVPEEAADDAGEAGEAEAAEINDPNFVPF